MLRAQDMMLQDYTVIDSDQPLSQAVHLFKQAETILVVEDNHFQGAILKNDLMKAKLSLETKVKTYLKHVPQLKKSDSAEDISRLMLESSTYQLPVIEKDKIIGVVKTDTILQKMMETEFAKEPIKNYMTTPVLSVSPQESVGKVIKLFKLKEISRLPVIEDGKIKGIITMDDILSTLVYPETKPSGVGKSGERVAEKKHILDLPVEGVMNKRPLIMSPDAAIKDVINKMLRFNLRGMLLGSNETLSGVITKKDLLEPIVSSTQQIPLYIQFAGELRCIRDFNNKEQQDYLQAALSKYIDHLKNIQVYVHLKQHDEKMKGMHLIYCRIRLFSSKGMFIASDEGWGCSDAIRNTFQGIEKQIQRTKKR
jgi:predicted transcriptional regulator